MPISQLGADVLRQQALAIDDFNSPWFHALLTEMKDAMFSHDGVGIAAPQLGHSWQMIIIASRPTRRYPHAPLIEPIVMINPRFQISDDHRIKDWEGCLSIPGIRALVPRYQAVKVAYLDEQGQQRQISLEGFPARVFQHEYDHLLGKVFLDRVDDNQDIIAESEYQKRIAA